ncbi:hypothetical protein BJ508DRAFT_63226 [Ascobolus immersus RN42]|uniref:Uncharacterized protein n=1 Tax=Ascobolus immersus RN42 TaxID=1160509 RepID=A0A3N4J164_ASCIM|nr:hypothetical protein BJ508DRAFT_63226 [Ascobolus immersus RN42]
MDENMSGSKNKRARGGMEIESPMPTKKARVAGKDGKERDGKSKAAAASMDASGAQESKGGIDARTEDERRAKKVGGAVFGMVGIRKDSMALAKRLGGDIHLEHYGSSLSAASSSAASGLSPLPLASLHPPVPTTPAVKAFSPIEKASCDVLVLITTYLDPEVAVIVRQSNSLFFRLFTKCSTHIARQIAVHNSHPAVQLIGENSSTLGFSVAWKYLEHLLELGRLRSSSLLEGREVNCPGFNTPEYLGLRMKHSLLRLTAQYLVVTKFGHTLGSAVLLPKHALLIPGLLHPVADIIKTLMDRCARSLGGFDETILDRTPMAEEMEGTVLSGVYSLVIDVLPCVRSVPFSQVLSFRGALGVFMDLNAIIRRPLEERVCLDVAIEAIFDARDLAPAAVLPKPHRIGILEGMKFSRMRMLADVPVGERSRLYDLAQMQPWRWLARITLTAEESGDKEDVQIPPFTA